MTSRAVRQGLVCLALAAAAVAGLHQALDALLATSPAKAST